MDPIKTTKALTLVMHADRGDEQADKDLEALKTGLTTSMFRQSMPESYFHQLRLRVAEDPSLADKIQVLYEDYDGTVKEIGLTDKDIFGPNNWWPVSFSKKLWDIELKISRVTHDKRESEKQAQSSALPTI